MTRSLILTLLALSLCAPVLARAQDTTVTPTSSPKAAPAPSEHMGFMTSGNKAYNAGAYTSARDFYVQAVQLYPQGAAAYKNIARTYFWENQFAAATHFYDVYLTQAPKASDVAQLQQERKLASSRAAERPWALPSVQSQALAALEGALTSGQGYARGKGAAHEYDALLRTGYAEPDLVKLRQRLSLKLLTEHDDLLEPTPGQLVPNLAIQAWDEQRIRLRTARAVATLDIVKSIDDRLTLGEAARTLLIKDYAGSVPKLRAAITANPDMIFAHWMLITALLQSQSLDDAQAAIDALDALLKSRNTDQRPYLSVVRAMLAQKRGESVKAAKMYKSMLIGESL